MVDGIIFGGMILRDRLPQNHDSSEISYTSVKRHSGSHRIATYLRQHGLNIEVVDFAPSWTFEEFKELINSRVTKDTKFVGLGSFFDMNTKLLSRCFVWLKQTYPDIIIVTGSHGFYNLHHIPADYMVVGYGEKAILEILKGNAKYKEEITNEQGATVRTVYALDNYPAYPMKDLSIDFEKRDFIEPYEAVTIETSRGCKFKCAFCYYPLLGVKEDHTIAPENFRDNLLRNYENYGLWRYTIADETFNDHTEKIIKYADVVENLPFTPKFGGYIRPDLLCTRPGDIEHLARMQFNGHFYGVESFNRPSAAAIGKGMDPDKIKQAILDTKKYITEHNAYYRGTISLIVGLPHETQETLAMTNDWLHQNWKTNHIHILPLVIATEYNNGRKSTLADTYQKQGYTEIDVSQNDYSNMEEWAKLIVEKHYNATPGAIRWKSNTGMTEKDAIQWIIQNLRAREDYLDFGVDQWIMDEWYIVGKTDQDLMGSYRDLGGIFPPVQSKIDFIEAYKKKKLNYNG